MNSSVQEREIGLKEIFLIVNRSYVYIKSKWLILFICFLVGASIGLGYAITNKTVYTATTTFVLEDANGGGGMGQYAGIASMIGLDVGGSGGGIFQGDNIIQLYKSRMMVEKTLLDSFSYNNQSGYLIDYYIKFNKLRDNWKGSRLKNIQFHLKNGQKFNRTQDSIIGRIVQDINNKYLNVFKPDKKLSIIEVQVKAENELFAKLLNNQIVKNVNDFYVMTKTKKSLQNISILQHQADSIRYALNNGITTVALSTDANPNPNLSKQILRAPSQKKQVDIEANKAMLLELVKNLEISKVALRKETPLIQVIDEPVLPLEVQRPHIIRVTIGVGILASILGIFALLIVKIIKQIMI